MHGNNPTVQNVELLNPYNGIKIEKGGRQNVRDVCGQPLHIACLGPGRGLLPSRKTSLEPVLDI